MASTAVAWYGEVPTCSQPHSRLQPCQKWSEVAVNADHAAVCQAAPLLCCVILSLHAKSCSQDLLDWTGPAYRSLLHKCTPNSFLNPLLTSCNLEERCQARVVETQQVTSAPHITRHPNLRPAVQTQLPAATHLGEFAPEWLHSQAQLHPDV